MDLVEITIILPDKNEVDFVCSRDFLNQKFTNKYVYIQDLDKVFFFDEYDRNTYVAIAKVAGINPDQYWGIFPDNTAKLIHKEYVLNGSYQTGHPDYYLKRVHVTKIVDNKAFVEVESD